MAEAPAEGTARHVVFVEMSMSGAGERCLEYCRQAGYEVTLATRDPARHEVVADGARLLECDTNDGASLLVALTSLHAHRPIDGVTTTHDFYVPHAALAAETLGLPGLTFHAASGVRNKYRMRRRLERACPHLNPPFRLVRDDGEALRAAEEWGFPLIAKPQDMNDSWNVARIDSEPELVEYMRAAAAWSRNPVGQPMSPGVLLEGYIEGDEYSVDTVQHKGGEIELLGVFVKELVSGDGRHFAEAGGWFPVRGAPTEVLFREASLALDALGIDCGVIHTECRVAGDEVKILEINPRLAGDMLGSHMIELAVGASPVQQVVETALGNPVSWRPTKTAGAGLFAIFMPRSGPFGGIDNLDEVRASPGVEQVRLMVEPGTYCRYPPLSNLDFVARVVTAASTPEAALELAKAASARAQVRVD